jgi:hypothetical protein
MWELCWPDKKLPNMRWIYDPTSCFRRGSPLGKFFVFFCFNHTAFTLSRVWQSSFPLSSRWHSASFAGRNYTHRVTVTSNTALQSPWAGPRDSCLGLRRLGQTNWLPDLDGGVGPRKRPVRTDGWEPCTAVGGRGNGGIKQHVMCGDHRRAR